MEDNIRECIYIYIYTHIYIYMYDWVTLLYSRNWHNIVNQLYLNLKNKHCLNLQMGAPDLGEKNTHAGFTEKVDTVRKNTVAKGSHWHFFWPHASYLSWKPQTSLGRTWEDWNIHASLTSSLHLSSVLIIAFHGLLVPGRVRWAAAEAFTEIWAGQVSESTEVCFNPWYREFGGEESQQRGWSVDSFRGSWTQTGTGSCKLGSLPLDTPVHEQFGEAHWGTPWGLVWPRQISIEYVWVKFREK